MTKKKWKQELLQRTQEFNWKRAALLWLAALLFGCCVELLYEGNVQRRAVKGPGETGVVSLPEDSWSIAPKEKKGQEGHRIPAQGSIGVQMEERYIEKLRYDFKARKDFTATIQITTKDAYKQPIVEEITEQCRSHMDHSYVYVGDYVTAVTITFSEPVEVSSVQIDNSFGFNWYRVLFYMTLAGVVLTLLLGGNYWNRNIEKAFAFLALSFGILFLILEPTEGTSWDEHIHIDHTAVLFGGDETWNGAEKYLYYKEETMEGVPFNTREEQRQQNEYLDSLAGKKVKRTAILDSGLDAVSYLHMALVYEAGLALGLPYFLVYKLTKLANLLVYVVLVYFAIKLLPGKKGLMAVIALMPSPMVLATAFSYDPVLIGCNFFGIAMVMRMYGDETRKITWKDIFLYLAVMAYGNTAKAIYIVLMLPVFFIPRKRFAKEKICWVFKGLAAVLCLGYAMSFVLPSVTGHMKADYRGGDTSVSGQLQFLLSHPLGYAGILLKSIWNAAGDYLLGRESMAHIAYGKEGYLRWYSLTGAVMAVTAFTEHTDGSFFVNKKNERIFQISTLVSVIGLIGLIWTSMYLAFTVPGSMQIVGVQGRYYLPFMFSLVYLFSWKKKSDLGRSRWYYTGIFLVSSFMLAQWMYQPYFLRYCM